VNRRGLGRGRLLASVGALLALLSMALPWWRVGGSPGIPESSGNGLSGAGIVVLLAAVLILALVALPYAGGDRPQPLDRPASFAIATALGVVGLGVTVLQLLDVSGLGLPDRSPGLWLAAAGMALAVWGSVELTSERQPPVGRL
jgi:hypothetical protein